MSGLLSAEADVHDSKVTELIHLMEQTDRAEIVHCTETEVKVRESVQLPRQCYSQIRTRAGIATSHATSSMSSCTWAKSAAQMETTQQSLDSTQRLAHQL